MLATLVVLTFVGAVVWVTVRPHEPSGRDESFSFNAVYGKFRVRYPEGYYSQCFCKDLAEDYAEMFGGTVVPSTEYKTVKEVQDAKAAQVAINA